MAKLSKNITQLLEKMDSIQRHTAEIGFQWGQYFEKNQVSIPDSTFDLQDSIIELAEKFEKEVLSVNQDHHYLELIDEFIKDEFNLEEKRLQCSCGWQGHENELSGVECGGGSFYIGCPECKKENSF